MKLKLIDAFTDTPLQGNPCAVLLEADHLSNSQMLAIAKEMNQSETAFVMRSQHHTLKARYFTPECEIPLAGHPTIASIHAAIESGLIQRPSTKTSISLELNDGPIRVDIEPLGALFLVRMFQRRPQFLKQHDPKVISEIFNLQPNDFLEGVPIQTVSTGSPMLMIPLKTKLALKKVKINADLYKKYKADSDFFSPHFFVLEGESKDANTFARNLSVAPDLPEDAFTGSATGCMGAYLWKYGLITQNKIIAEQGHWMGRPGRAYVEAVGSFNDLQSVVVSGTAVTVVNGEIFI